MMALHTVNSDFALREKRETFQAVKNSDYADRPYSNRQLDLIPTDNI